MHFSENYAIILSVLSASPPDTKRISAWGISTVGSARHSHCRGQEFESPMLHGWSRLKSLGLFFCLQTSRNKKPTGRRISPLPGRVLFAIALPRHLPNIQRRRLRIKNIQAHAIKSLPEPLRHLLDFRRFRASFLVEHPARQRLARQRHLRPAVFLRSVHKPRPRPARSACKCPYCTGRRPGGRTGNSPLSAAQNSTESPSKTKSPCAAL